MKINNVKDLCDFIFLLERKYKLLDLKLNDVYIWHYYRMNIYYQLAVRCGILEKPHLKNNKKAFISKIKSLLNVMKFCLFRNSFLSNNGPVDVAIFEHNRSCKVDNEFVDIYSDHIKDELESAGTSFALLDCPYNYKHSKTKNNQERIFLDFIYTYSRIHSIFNPVKFSVSDVKLIRAIESDINEHLNIIVNLESIFKSGIKRFKSLQPQFKLLFKKLEIKELLIVVSYGFYDVISAAKELGIKVTELQHGIISKYHLGYNFNDCNFSKAYLPDELICWSTSWKEVVGTNFSKVTVKDFRYQKNQINKYLDQNIDRKAITVISQGAIGIDIANYVQKNYSLYFSQADNVFFKLHPSEFSIKSDFKFLELLPNLKIMTDEIDLYELLANSYTVFGVFSTVLFEAESMGCDVKLMPIQGVENVSAHPTFKLMP
ncbi:hypothetical protein H4J58_00640 [Colwellia sp. MB3u-70]|uniref:hypothetical protein n=1 Tax=unclassified Colwellia TaxID=196834 RepID=UPI0015F571CF|nr:MULTISPECIES: hypothetical protein [unclassified Colwellia]MBA6291507.1 hypothetical protein [Colwellia sp. MB3u-8]MBA6305649.1 hypothetical protein [Colwellia sp. MB3u-70]